MIEWYIFLASALFRAVCVDTKTVLAHFMLPNADQYALSDWQTDILDAQAAKIDGFALNFAADQADRQASNDQHIHVHTSVASS